MRYKLPILSTKFYRNGTVTGKRGEILIYLVEGADYTLGLAEQITDYSCMTAWFPCAGLEVSEWPIISSR